ncbi:MAG: tRNA adenosine(34) deaminase TadA [Oscillospiraceae bacterium]|nr:tRNA adenosine(34) deaminase TadA [Clostridia bacterium]MBP3699388.1 tRNA adenosine(34) deaminase TadA [Oscillospiraceae bacterium]
MNSFSTEDEFFMRLALDEAHVAMMNGDVPVGAVLIQNSTGEILSKGHNTKELLNTALGHAEITAIANGCDLRRSWRLSDTTLYVTLEPCSMCAGAILHARIPRVVYGASDPVAGAMGSIWALHRHPVENKHTKVEHGCLEEECRELMARFFSNRRE